MVTLFSNKNFSTNLLPAAARATYASADYDNPLERRSPLIQNDRF